MSFINGTTNLVGLVGYPVSQSLSPVIHNFLFHENKINYVYLPFPVKRGFLEDAIKGLIALGVKGFNVTIPYKEEIVPFLDNIDNNARFVGAVNTIVVEDKKLFGYNTDVSGFTAAVHYSNVDLKGKKAVVLGAGGASRAVITSLAQEGVRQICIVNRTLENAVCLVKEFTSKLPVKLLSYSFNDETCYNIISKADIIVNTTSVGMEGKEKKCLFPKELLFPNQTVIDIVYKPLETPLLKIASERGCKTVNGLGMLIEQALHSFKIWTNIQPSREDVDRFLKRKQII